VITRNQYLQLEAVEYFKNIYKAHSNLCITDQLTILKNYPRMITEEDNHRVTESVIVKEILKTLKGFKGSKSHGHDGCIVEFFLSLFDILGSDLVDMVEDSRKKARVFGALNATFLVLIPKGDNLDSFGGFRPISLCNLVYKIINKIIASRIKNMYIFWYFKGIVWIP